MEGVILDFWSYFLDEIVINKNTGSQNSVCQFLMANVITVIETWCHELYSRNNNSAIRNKNDPYENDLVIGHRLRTFAPKISHVQIFLKLWLQV